MVTASADDLGDGTSTEPCHGCRRTGLALLACDDPNGSPTQNREKPRFCAQCMIGKQVKVFWPVDESWYTGTVQQYDPSTGEHLLRYDDNDTEWVKIGDQSGPDGPPSGADEDEGQIPPEVSAGQVQSYSNDPSGGGATAADRHQWGGAQGGLGGRGGMGGLPTQQQNFPYGGGNMAPHGMFPPHGYGGPIGGMGGAGQYGGGFPGQHGGFKQGGGHPASQFGYPSNMLGMPGPDAGGPAGGRGRNNKESGASPPSAGGKRKSGPKAWTKEEDAMLLALVQGMRMPMKWSIVAQSMADRTGKQCRERYVNHLNPRLKVSDWSPVEDATIFHLYNTTGSHWAKMSKMIPGRTDNGIKNRFHNLRRQLEREDEHRLRLSKATDFPNEIRLDRVREFPQSLRGKSDELWDMRRGIGILAAQSVLGGGIARNAGRFGPFRAPRGAEPCVRCGLLVPSVQCGTELCDKTGWCQSCTRVPPHVSGSLLRECLNLRRCQEPEKKEILESFNNGDDQ